VLDQPAPLGKSILHRQHELCLLERHVRCEDRRVVRRGEPPQAAHRLANGRVPLPVIPEQCLGLLPKILEGRVRGEITDHDTPSFPNAPGACMLGRKEGSINVPVKVGFALPAGRVASFNRHQDSSPGPAPGQGKTPGRAALPGQSNREPSQLRAHPDGFGSQRERSCCKRMAVRAEGGGLRQEGPPSGEDASGLSHIELTWRMQWNARTYCSYWPTIWAGRI
jgi:hypothetical protein